MEPEEFCEIWIPKLYGIYPGENLYRKACIQEMTRHLPAEASNAYRNWHWTNGRTEYPKYLPAFLELLDQKYAILEKLDALPRYTISRG